VSKSCTRREIRAVFWWMSTSECSRTLGKRSSAQQVDVGQDRRQGRAQLVRQVAQKGA
jgi:hypothetical protein